MFENIRKIYFKHHSNFKTDTSAEKNNIASPLIVFFLKPKIFLFFIDANFRAIGVDFVVSDRCFLFLKNSWASLDNLASLNSWASLDN